MCFPSKLNQVFLNIIVNAIQSIEDKGSIFISTKLSDVENNKMIQVDIIDNGKGMSPEVRSKIFEPFFTTKEVGAGTGLGLSISYSIIEKHKGRIISNSKLGEGTKFSIFVPV